MPVKNNKSPESLEKFAQWVLAKSMTNNKTTKKVLF